MASTCRLSYIPLSEEDRAESRPSVDADSAQNITSEKHQTPRSKVDIEQLNRGSSGRIERLRCHKCSLTVRVLLILVCFATLGLVARVFLFCSVHPAATGVRLESRGQNAHPVVEEILISHAKPSSSPVLEVFQVYQPVLTPSGPTDETSNSNGSSNTTAIGSTETFAGCTQLLMEYSFGFSYGHPFVGMFPSVYRHFYLMLTNTKRNLYSALMPI